MKKYLWLFVCLLLCPPVIAQDPMTMPDGTVMAVTTTTDVNGNVTTAVAGSNYAVTTRLALTDNRTNCQNFNCFLSGVGGAVLQMSSGFDGFVVGVGTDNRLYNLPQMSTTGGKSSWQTFNATTGFQAVAVRSASEIYALITASECSSVGYRVYHYNGSTWTAMSGYPSTSPGCLYTVSVTTDGMLIGTDSTHVLWYTYNPTAAAPTWHRFAGTGWVAVAGLNTNTAYAIYGTTLEQLNLSNNTYTAVPSTSPVKSVAVTDGGLLFVLTTSTYAKGNVWYQDVSLASPAWIAVYGTMSNIYGSTLNGLFGANASGVPYHYLATALSVFVATNGYYDCSRFGVTGQCPTNSVHTATAKAGFPSGYFYGKTVTQSGAPAQALYAEAQDTSQYCDPFFGDPGSNYCGVSLASGDVHCSIMGSVFSGGGLLSMPHWSKAFTRTIYLGTNRGCTTGKSGVTWCNYNVNNWCNIPSGYVMNSFDGEAIRDIRFHGFWDVTAVCINWGNGWVCSYGWDTPLDGTQPQASCTSTTG